MGKQRQDLENSLKRKEADMFSLSVRFEEAQSQAAKVQRQAQVLAKIIVFIYN
jgi:hypothetical protein